MRLALLQLCRAQTGWYIRHRHGLWERPTDTEAREGIICHPFSTVPQGSDVTHEGAKHVQFGQGEQVVGSWIPVITPVGSRLEYSQEPKETWMR